jgi:hypothetical protein
MRQHSVAGSGKLQQSVSSVSSQTVGVSWVAQWGCARSARNRDARLYAQAVLAAAAAAAAAAVATARAGSRQGPRHGRLVLMWLTVRPCMR